MALASPAVKREILLCGGTGRTGGATIDALLSLLEEREEEEESTSIRICALVRDPSAAAAKALEAKGVVLKQGDYNDPSSLKEAFAGVDACFLACSNTIDQAQQEINVIKAAAAEAAAAAAAAAKDDRRGRGGPLYLVKISTCQTQVQQAPPYISKDSIIQYGQYHAKIEEKLQEIAAEASSNGKLLQYTCLRPNYFIQNFISDIMGTIPNQNAIIYPQQNSYGANLIDVRDIGTIAAKLLLLDDDDDDAKRQESYHGKFLNICGPKSWTLQEITQEFSKAFGSQKDIQLIRCSPKDYSNTLEKFGVPDWLAKSIANTHSVFWDNNALSYESSSEIYDLLPPKNFRTFQDWIQEMKMANGGGSTKA